MTASTVDSHGMGVPQEGRFEGSSVPDLLWDLAEARHTGSLILEQKNARKVIFLRDGRVVFAASSSQEDRLGPFLLRRGQVGLSVLLDAGGQVIRGRRLGQVLIERQAMSQDEVVRAVLDQVREIALSVFPWRSGSWRVSRACLAQDESVTLDLPMEELILAGVRRVRDWRWIRRATGGPRAVYRVTKRGSDATLALGLTERAILEQLEHAARVDLLCREVYAPSYDVYRALWALSILGLVERLDPTLVSEAFQGPGEGFLDRGGAADLFLRYGSLGLSGVLRLFHDGEEGAVFFRDGRIEFATTNDPEQSLVVHLLRRGIISDQDHEVALRQLISGKRVGTLLAELGALGDEEVERFVREQVRDVAQRLVLWEEGEYQVEEGLPTKESVTLGWSAEDVVMEALECLENTEKVWNGLGGLDALFRLRPEYLDRLDRMRLRPEIWELVSSLRAELTLAEILEKRPEPDFEICRMLYALERVHVLEKVSQEEILSRARARAQNPDPVPVEQPPSFLVAGPGGSVGEDASGTLAVDAEGGRGSRASGMAPELFESEERAVPLELPKSWAAAPYGEDDDDVFNSEDDPWETQKRAHFELDEVLARGQQEIEAAQEKDSVALEVSALTVGRGLGASPELEDEEDAAGFEEQSSFVEVDSNSFHQVLEARADAEPDPAPDAGTEPDPDAEIESTLDLGPEPGDELEPTLELESKPAPGPESIMEREPAPEAEPESEPVMEREPAPEAELESEPVMEREPAPEAELESEPVMEREPAPEVESVPEAAVDIAPVLAASVLVARGVGKMDAERPVELPQVPIEQESSAETGVSEPPLLPEEEPTIYDLDARSSEAKNAAVVDLEDIPAALLRCVDRFNARHSVLFAQLRQEIGAGVRNYILTCQKRLGEGSKVFEGLSPDGDGAFDREQISRRLLQSRPAPWDEPLDALIDVELSMVRGLLTSARYSEIELSLRAAENA